MKNKEIILNTKFKRIVYWLGVRWGYVFGLVPGVIIRLIKWDDEIWDTKVNRLTTKYQRFCYKMGYPALILSVFWLLLLAWLMIAIIGSIIFGF